MVAKPPITPSPTQPTTADDLQKQLFLSQPSAVLQRMIQNGEIPVSNPKVQNGLVQFFANQPNFNIRKTSVNKAFTAPEAFNGIPANVVPNVKNEMASLQRLQALTSNPDTISHLLDAGIKSAFHVSTLSPAEFHAIFAGKLSLETANSIHSHALNARFVQESRLTAMQQYIRGTGLKAIDGPTTQQARADQVQGFLSDSQVNLTSLFGSLDYCTCSDCNSILSPAAYLVELLNFLRNNNLDPKKNLQSQTLLDAFKRRRPDILRLELTCANTNTILPYIDLANEIMESFVVHLDQYETDKTTPKHVSLDVFNTSSKDPSALLLASPQNINYGAYAIVKDATYPFSLPYNRGIDEIRVYLNWLGTSRTELIDVFRSSCTPMPGVNAKQLIALHTEIIDRARDAEFLTMLSDEYKVIFKEVFWPKEYFELTTGKSMTDAEYRAHIGVHPIYEYWGYQSEAEFTDSKTSLANVSSEFLPRSGMSYTDLVDLLKTAFINPYYPQGWPLKIFDSLRFSYAYLQTLVESQFMDPRRRFAQLIQYLNSNMPLGGLYDTSRKGLVGAETNHPTNQVDNESAFRCSCDCRIDYRFWVYKYFDQLGNLIVLDSQAAPSINIQGHVEWVGPSTRPPLGPTTHRIGQLYLDGTIKDSHMNSLGKVNFNGTVTFHAARTTAASTPNFSDYSIQIVSLDGTSVIAYAQGNSTKPGTLEVLGSPIAFPITHLINPPPISSSVSWSVNETCDISKVKLMHLNGTPLTDTEYDRIMQFVRLRNRLGWTIDELDKALAGLAKPPPAAQPALYGSAARDVHDITFDDLRDTDAVETCQMHGTNQPPKPMVIDIKSSDVKQAVAIQKLLKFTNLPLAKLLTFWADISTVGENSLYAQLFLQHDIVGMDSVFQPDDYGNYLQQSGIKMSDHYPSIQATMQIRLASDLIAIIVQKKLTDELTISNLSVIYRYVLLATFLGISLLTLLEVVKTFQDPFVSPEETYKTLTLWNEMINSGFTFYQLGYILQDMNDPQMTLKPTTQTVLNISNSLYNGLVAINATHPDIPPPAPMGTSSSMTSSKSTGGSAPSDVQTTSPPDPTLDDSLVTSELALLFDATTVSSVVALLNGTTVYTTTATLQTTVTIPSNLGKVQYTNQPPGTLQVTGILTSDELAQTLALSAEPDWKAAVNAIVAQPAVFFDKTLSGIFNRTIPGVVPGVARSIILSGDVPANPIGASSDTTKSFQTNSTSPTTGGQRVSLGTAPGKRYQLLLYLEPFLRTTLSTHLVVSTMATFSTLPTSTTQLLLQNVITETSKGTNKSAFDILEGITSIRQTTKSNTWNGYLIPPTSDAYTFVASSPGASITVGGGLPYQLSISQDSGNSYLTIPVALVAGTIYPCTIVGGPLQWQNARSPRATIPPSALLPDFAIDSIRAILIELSKLSMILTTLALSDAEIDFWNSIPISGSSPRISLQEIDLAGLRRLSAYCKFRNSLPPSDSTLLDLFSWAVSPTAGTVSLAGKIAKVTGWDEDTITKLIAPSHFNLNVPSHFQDELQLMKLQKAIAVSTRVGVDVNSLFDWAVPLMKFWPAVAASERIQKTIRARFTLTNWEQIVQPLNNIIRENSKNALISYLLLQPELRKQGITEADGLFEFFLIDVQMSSCLQTSRIKQAISTVQLYVQRCLLGLEGDAKIDKEKWASMESQTLYVARRNVFLYPENWLQESLRDDKTPIYQQLESSITQNDVTPQSAAKAIQTYLFSLADIANLHALGLYWDGKSTVYIIARSPNPPFIYYYRTYSTNNTWTPWQTVQVDIPNYKLVTTPGQISGSGTYLTPILYQGRLFIVFPQFTKITTPPIRTSADMTNFHSVGDAPVVQADPSQSLQIQLCWSELRGGTWTKKQVCESGLYVPSGGLDLDILVSRFLFVPNATTDPPSVEIYQTGAISNVVHSAAWIGRAELVNGNLVTTPPPRAWTIPWYGLHAGSFFEFQYQVPRAGSLTALSFLRLSTLAGKPVGISAAPTVTYQTDSSTSVLTALFYGPRLRSGMFRFNHPFCDAWLGSITFSESVKTLFASIQGTQMDLGPSFGVQFNELTEPYSVYNWELMFHAPMELVNQLRLAQHYDQALAVLQYIFDPRTHGSDINTSSDNGIVWKFPPFKTIVAVADTLDAFFQSLAPGTENAAVTDWRYNPFSPFAVARSRPVAFMKWVVMTYIGILIDYGDYYFRQNTLESIPLAIQLYVMASHLFGPAPHATPKRGEIKVETYESLLDQWDAFDNAVVDLELAFPFSNQIETPTPPFEMAGVSDTPNIFGFATTRYFCIPNNPKLVALRSTVDDRLFKIRHCQDINGVVRSLALWEPPLDVSQLVAAAAAGLSISSVLNDLSAPLPNFRFVNLLDRAMGMLDQLRSLGESFLSVKEKKDGEALALLRAQQDAVLQDLITTTKHSAITAANAAIDTLNQQREAAVQRMTHYLQLTGDDTSIIPNPSAPFQELVDTIDPPRTDGQLRLLPGEQQQLDLAGVAGNIRLGTQLVRAISAILLVEPKVSFYSAPLGVGATTEWGPSDIGNATNAVADGVLALADFVDGQSQSSGTRASFLRALQDRRQIINEIGFEITTIDKQVAEQRLRVTIANQELAAQQNAAANSHVVQTFFQNKYSNVALYTWMESQVRSLYYQTYTLAYDLAKSAEAAFHFERPQDTQTYIRYGYWDPAHDGLFCGDRLYSGLQQLSLAYRQQRGWDFELSKHISLKRLDPLSWLQLRESGTCQFDIPEILFDLDFPGHYNRRLKSVDVTLPCVVGPYTQVNCTLRLLKHQYRVSAAETSPNDYEEKTGDDGRFRTCVVPISAIATSSGTNDSGVFELSFEGERYMPFEGAGVISTWELDLPTAYQQFDYSTISDVILHFKYTSLDGGALLASAAKTAVKNFVTTHQESHDLYTIFDIPNEFPEQWQNSLNPPAGASSRIMVFENVASLIPVYILPSNKNAPTVQTYIHFISSDPLYGLSVSVLNSGLPPLPSFGTSSLAMVADLYQYATTGPITLKAGQSWQVTVDTKSTLGRVWMLVKYWYY